VNGSRARTVLGVLGLAVRLDHLAVHDHPCRADVEGSGF
jgi:hypothetical protein